MKKVKIMLTAITVFAVVGGALAFKAQKFGLIKVCSGSGPEKENCQNLAVNLTTTVSGQQQVYYTQVADDATNCDAVIECPSSTFLKAE